MSFLTVRQLSKQSERVETGPVRFGDDWAGVFIRGDSAFAYAVAIKRLLEFQNIDPIFQMDLEGLLKLLQSSNEEAIRSNHAKK